ncbi:MAG: hypothetical protein IPO70_07940 [Bacteroidetes bacterium]|nr:hypothetical protein [Bacteroidota bacterium]
MKKIVFSLFLTLYLFCAQPLFSADLIGYWHNWNDINAPYIPLTQIDSRYTIIEVAFAVPTSPSDMTMTFVPDGITQAQFYYPNSNPAIAWKKSTAKHWRCNY